MFYTFTATAGLFICNAPEPERCRAREWLVGRYMSTERKRLKVDGTTGVSEAIANLVFIKT